LAKRVAQQLLHLRPSVWQDSGGRVVVAGSIARILIETVGRHGSGGRGLASRPHTIVASALRAPLPPRDLMHLAGLQGWFSPLTR
jgi:hypothetical protein